MNELFIWWLSQDACDAMDQHYHTGFRLAGMRDDTLLQFPVPEYVKVEYRRRYGRAAHARLWVHETIECDSIQWPVRSPIVDWIQNGGYDGIVCRMEDFESIRALPGFITDLALNKL